MKKIITIIVAVLMVFTLAACGGGTTDPEPAPAPAPAPAPETPAAETPAEETPASNLPYNLDNVGDQKFILAHGMPETGMTAIQYHEFAVAVAELSEGKMIVEERIGGTLLTDTETLDGVMNGTADFVHSMGSYVTGTVTDLSPLTIAGYYGGDDWQGFINDTRSLVTDIYGEYGIRYMAALNQGHSVIACTEMQIKTPADVKGLAFRASGTWVSKTVEAWGGAATTIGLADLADSFNKGVVQGVATGLNIIVPFKIFESAKYITKSTMSEGFAALLMNGERWDSLNADEQALLNEAALIFEAKSVELANGFMESYMAEIEDSGRNEIYFLTAAEQQQFVELAYGLYPQMEPELGAKGIELIGLLKKANGIG